MRVTRHRYAVEGWGVGEIWADGALLVAHDLPGTLESSDGDMSTRSPGRAPHPGGARAPAFTVAEKPSRETDEIVPELCRRVCRHLAGRETAYDDLPVDDGWCTEFEHELLRALRSVPWGEVVTYGELAALAGRPRAARAAGTFCARNRYALIVPCHRVVAADGIGGYGHSRIGLKRRLLSLEGTHL